MNGEDAILGEQGENLLFVVGQYKSGSTWLVNLLSAHPLIRGLSETNVIRYSVEKDREPRTADLFSKTAWSEGGFRNLPKHRMAKWFGSVLQGEKKKRSQSERPNTLLDLSVWDQMGLKRNLLRTDSKEDYCREFFRFLYAQLQPGTYLVEKTPNNIFYVPFIRSVFPKAKLLSIYRDGRDVIVSEKHHKRRLGKTNWSLESSISMWGDAMRAQMKYADQYELYTVCYEELLGNGNILVGKILEFLNIPADTEKIGQMLHTSSIAFLTGRNKGQEDKNSFYRKGVSGDWRNHLTESDQALFKSLAGDLLIKLGYERNDSW